MRRAVVILGALVLVATAVAAPVTLARFASDDDAEATFSTGSILPPTALAASVSGTTVTLTWTPTVSAGVEGYDVLRSATSGSGYVVVSSVTPRTASTTTNNPRAGTWYYVLRSSLSNWRSTASNQASATVPSLATGFKTCTTNVADTGGDNNGYQTNRNNACVPDGAVAVDSNSGTNTVLSCTNAGKDRHRFGGYSFGLPGTVGSVDGIELTLVASLNSTTGTSYLCIQLSPDGGTTWTATKQATLTSTSLSTYTVGGATDTWGRTWTAAELASGTFVVRVIDVSNQSTKTFRLDGVSAQVHYSP